MVANTFVDSRCGLHIRLEPEPQTTPSASSRRRITLANHFASLATSTARVEVFHLEVGFRCGSHWDFRRKGWRSPQRNKK